MVSGRDLMMENIESMVGTAINIIPQRIRLTNKIKKDIQSVYAHNVKNMLYDKIDFYQSDICGRKLMDEIQTMIVFYNYYDTYTTKFEYEYEKDQDDIDLSRYVDSLQNKYRLYMTCKKASYSKQRAEHLVESYIKIVRNIADELSNNL